MFAGSDKEPGETSMRTIQEVIRLSVADGCTNMKICGCPTIVEDCQYEEPYHPCDRETVVREMNS